MDAELVLGWNGALIERLMAAYFVEVEAKLRSAMIVTLDKDLNPSSHSAPVRAVHGAVLGKLDTTEMLSLKR